MTRSTAATADAYLSNLPADRRAVVSSVRDAIRRNLPAGYQEVMAFGMLTYSIPLERYPDTYNKQPLMYAALAAQKNYFALYLLCAYADPARAAKLRDAFARMGKKLDMGKSCLRFRSLDDLPLAVIGEIVAGVSPDEFIAINEAGRKRGPKKSRAATARPAGRKAPARAGR